MYRRDKYTTNDMYYAASGGSDAVLIAEPQGIIRMALLTELYAANMVPVAVGTATAAVEAACNGTFSAAVAEWLFEASEPGSVVAEIHRCKPELPIICTTSFDYKNAALNAGAAAVVEKPYLYSYIVQCIAAHIV